MTERPWRAKVGPPHLFDVIGAHQFCVAVKYGLRENHTLVDFGCGCLRAGKFFINYLAPYHYIGIEPDHELLSDGWNNEVGAETTALKWPAFYYWDDFKFADRLRGIYREVDFVLAHSILTHAGSDLAIQIANEAAEILKVNGAFIGTFFNSLSDFDGSGWLGDDVAQYRATTIEDMLRRVGFTNVKLLDLGHPMTQSWFVAYK